MESSLNRSNERYAKVSFDITENITIHGISGYFECTLWQDVMLSIHPNTHTVGMMSWFPIYFPLSRSLFLEHGQIMEVHFWRKTNGKDVWYEWCICLYSEKKVLIDTLHHNLNGKSFKIGL